MCHCVLNCACLWVIFAHLNLGMYTSCVDKVFVRVQLQCAWYLLFRTFFRTLGFSTRFLCLQYLTKAHLQTQLYNYNYNNDQGDGDDFTFTFPSGIEAVVTTIGIGICIGSTEQNNNKTHLTIRLHELETKTRIVRNSRR